MIELPQTRNNLFSHSERNEFVSKERIFIGDAKNGNPNALLDFWRDKRAMMTTRSDARKAKLDNGSTS